MGHSCIPHIQPDLTEPGPGALRSKLFNKSRKTKLSFQTQPGKAAPEITFRYVIKLSVIPKIYGKAHKQKSNQPGAAVSQWQRTMVKYVG